MLCFVIFTNTNPPPFSIGRIVQLVSRLPYTHVAIAFNEVVLDPWPSVALYYHLPIYLGQHPRYMVAVPIDHDLDLQIATPRNTRWATCVRALSCGLTGSDDCVSVVARCLRQGGLRVPHHLYSPAQLARWLVQREGCAVCNTTYPISPTSPAHH